MSDDGIKLEINGHTFKVDLLELLTGLLKGAAKTFVTLKTAGLSTITAPNLVTEYFGALKGLKFKETLELRAWLLVSGGLLYAIEKVVPELTLEKSPPANSL